jgi:putative MATE family efflux protein
MKSVPSLTSGSIPRTLFVFALPILLGNVLQSVNGSINAVWIGKFLGAAALTGANNSNIVIFLLLGAVFGVTMASTILIAQHVGSRRMEEAKKVTGSSATFFFVLSLLFSIGGFFAAPSILHWMGTPADAIGYGVDYLRVMFVALPASYAFFFVNGALRGAGDSKTPFRFLLMSVVLDIALNPLFIFGLGPLPALGIAGSALATLVAQSLSLAAILRHVYRERHPLAIHVGEWHMFRVDWGIIRSLVLKGVPMGLQMIVLSSSMVLFLRVVNRFGSDTAAAFAADMQLWTYVQMPALALGAAVSSMAAQNIGAKEWQRVADTAKYGVLFNMLLTGVPVLLIYLSEGLAISVFLPPGSPAVAIATHMNHIILWSYPLFGISMVLSGVVRAAGAVMAPLFILLVSLLIVRTPLAEYGYQHWGADGVWWSFSVSAIVAAALSTAYYLSGSWRSATMRVGSAA